MDFSKSSLILLDAIGLESFSLFFPFPYGFAVFLFMPSGS